LFCFLGLPGVLGSRFNGLAGIAAYVFGRNLSGRPISGLSLAPDGRGQPGQHQHPAQSRDDQTYFFTSRPSAT
ncbi:MAG TPA: hypothetical protein VMY42_00280, partial [Thermoguttaceae bacterium]|nr:hypothetical protein [Thermoguttaceae bacterium]